MLDKPPPQIRGDAPVPEGPPGIQCPAMNPETPTLTEFLLARIAEDEAWVLGDGGQNMDDCQECGFANQQASSPSPTTPTTATTGGRSAASSKTAVGMNRRRPRIPSRHIRARCPDFQLFEGRVARHVPAGWLSRRAVARRHGPWRAAQGAPR